MFRKIIISVAIIGGVLLVTAVVMGRVFEDELTQYVLTGLNNQIRTEVKVEDVKLSFLKKFPDASLEFRDIFITSVPDFNSSVFLTQNTDTLLAAEKLFLRFNVLKLLKRQYIIREVQVHSGILNIFIDRAGKGNFVFWEKKDGDGEKSFLFELDNVSLTDIHVRFDNRALEISIGGLLYKSFFKGQFSREAYNLSAGFEGMLHHYTNAGGNFLNQQRISSTASMFIDPQSIQISGGDFMLAGQKLLVSGKILRPKPLHFDLDIEGNQLDLENILRYLVISNDKLPRDIRAGGNLNFHGQVKGTASNTKMPRIEALFTLQDG
ncbi:hypothetical protein ACFLR8_00255 [Bacteroidota bacterium]